MASRSDHRRGFLEGMGRDIRVSLPFAAVGFARRPVVTCTFRFLRPSERRGGGIGREEAVYNGPLEARSLVLQGFRVLRGPFRWR